MPASFSTTARNALRYMLGTDLLSDVDEGFQRLAEDVDTKMASYSQDTFAKRPAAGQPNRFFRATDTGVLYHDTGSAWEAVLPSLVVSNTRAPVGGEFIELPGGGAPVVLPSPATSNKTVGIANVGAAGSGELEATTAVGEIYTLGKAVKLFPGEVIVLVADGANWIIRSIRRRTQPPVAEAAYTANEAHVMSTTRAVEVMLSISSPKQPPTIEWQLFTAGVKRQRGFVAQKEEEAAFTTTFVLLPGEAWQLNTAGPFVVSASYRVLGHE